MKRDPSPLRVVAVDVARAQMAPERIRCARCETVNCDKHQPASLSSGRVGGWQRFAVA
jgi:hypothetical protein